MNRILLSAIYMEKIFKFFLFLKKEKWNLCFLIPLIGALFLSILPFTAEAQNDCENAFIDVASMKLTSSFSSSLLDDTTGVQCGGGSFILNYGSDFAANDPDPSTPSGIRLLIFTAEPDIDGIVTLDMLRDHPDILKDTEGEPLIMGKEDSYQVSVRQGEGTPFGLRRPARIWLVPIIVHNTDSDSNAGYFENETCIFISTSRLFSIIFVNNIKPALGYTYDWGLKQFIVKLSGGLPEYDPEGYDYLFEVQNTVTGDDMEIIRHPENRFGFRIQGINGIYDIRARGKEGPDCGGSITGIPMSAPAPAVFIPDTLSYPDVEICLPVSIRNFVDIDSFFISVTWDTDVLKFNNIHWIDKSLYPTSSDFYAEHYQGQADIRWTKGDRPVSLPSDAVLFELCFTVTGKSGDRTPVVTVDGGGDRFYLGDEYYKPSVQEGSVEVVADDYIDFSYRILGCNLTQPDRMDLQVSVIGQYPPFTIEFDPAAGDPFTLDTHVDTLYLLSEGNYDMTVTDALGHAITLADQEIRMPDIPAAGWSIDESRTLNPTCYGKADGQIAVKMDGNPENILLRYYRTGGDTLSSAEVLIPELAAGKYHLWLAKPAGCGEREVRTVSLEDPELFELYIDEMEIPCDKENLRVSFQDYVSGGTGSIFYELNGGSAKDIGTDTLLQAGEYILYISDGKGCTASGDFRIHVASSDLYFDFDPAEDPVVVKEGEVFEVAVGTVTGGVVVGYDWVGIGGELLSAEEQQARFIFSHDGTIRLIVTDENGCSYNRSIGVEVQAGKEEENEEEEVEEETEEEREDHKIKIFLPNVFSPNGDGINDVLTIPIPDSGMVAGVNSLEIYDRYGALVFSETVSGDSYRTDIRWDGMIGNQTGPPGVYLARAILVLINGQRKEVVWSVMLVR